MLNDDGGAASPSMGETDTRLVFLRQIARAQFPFRLRDPDAVSMVQLLLQAGLVEGGVGESSADGQPVAIVRRITAVGRAHLALTRDSVRGALDW
ncbi:hypothetical protein [Pseudorhodoferax sp. Leaf274]|uniref:hypothetical protein n=1 Tax=Pseudorhodoferax sp. Leaf274 TaxID=1736318 RepID=UPI000703677B|nr:hypothetical protein [Pseudorhodoferax sp. Leaf274]KQP49189.1 hypothetical protein ASF44_00780 [Pseudorhodoferax sp. Leaf274]